MKKIALSALKDDLSRYLRKAEKEEVEAARHSLRAGQGVRIEDVEKRSRR